MIKVDVLHRAQRSWCFSLVKVPKKGSFRRLCVDYSKAIEVMNEVQEGMVLPGLGQEYKSEESKVTGFARRCDDSVITDFA